MATNNHMEELRQELRQVLEMTSRVDERLGIMAESQEHLVERFEKYIDQHVTLVERVVRLESIGKLVSTVEDMEKTLDTISFGLKEIDARGTSFAIKHIAALEAALKFLEERVDKLEQGADRVKTKTEMWCGIAYKTGEIVFKCAWVIGMAYILYRFGLGGVNFPP